MSLPSNYVVTSNYDMNVDTNGDFELFIIDADNENINIDVSSVYLYNGYIFKFLRVDNNALHNVTLTATGSGVTIGGLASVNLQVKKYCKLIFYNNDWQVISY